MFIAIAQAAGASGADASAGITATVVNFAPIVLIIIVFYFLLIRPQQQQQKQHRARLASIRRGDKVVTGGGILGQVTKATEGSDEVEVELAQNLRVTVLRSTISSVLGERSAETPAKAAPAPKKGAK